MYAASSIQACNFRTAKRMLSSCVRCSWTLKASIPWLLTRLACFSRSFCLTHSGRKLAVCTSKRTSTFVSTLFTFCPPGPLLREKRRWRSSFSTCRFGFRKSCAVAAKRAASSPRVASCTVPGSGRAPPAARGHGSGRGPRSEQPASPVARHRPLLQADGDAAARQHGKKTRPSAQSLRGLRRVRTVPCQAAINLVTVGSAVRP
mmetsp:Transcript_36910/g.114886  ORF Transcript_36910/g.114886 Transcript_36910/m.114886 type:complete len:204 (+) Transcript_36910:190-801(+)